MKLIPEYVRVWIKSSYAFLTVLGLSFLGCVLGSYYISHDFSWIAIYFPVLVAILFQRYSDDMKEVRACERKIACDIGFLKAYLLSTKEIYLKAYKGIISLNVESLAVDVSYDYNSDIKLDIFEARLNNVNASIDYMLYMSIKHPFFKQSRAVVAAVNSLTILGTVLGTYTMFLRLAKSGLTLQAMSFDQYKVLFHKVVNEQIDSKYKTPECIKKIEDAFSFFENLEIDSLFPRLRKKNLSV